MLRAKDDGGEESEAGERPEEGEGKGGGSASERERSRVDLGRSLENLDEDEDGGEAGVEGEEGARGEDDIVMEESVRFDLVRLRACWVRRRLP